MTPTLAELLASAELPDSDTARLDAELLLCHAIGKPRTYLRTWPERQPDAEQLRRFEQLMSQRRRGVPVAYLLGSQGFWSLQLDVSESTLIPRPDTERLVEVALEAGAKASYRVDDASEIDEAWLEGVEHVSVTSGASVPEDLVEGVLAFLSERGFPDARAVHSAEESLIFALPPELRRDLKAAT